MPAHLAAGLADALEHMPAGLEPLSRELAADGSLTADRELLRELVSVAVDEAGEALGARCSALLRGHGSASEIRAGIATLSGLIDLLERLAEEAQPGGGAAVDVDRLAGDEGRGG